MDRLKQLAAHFTSDSSHSGKEALFAKNPQDVVITFARRTPLTKAKKGGFKDTRSDELLVSMLRAVVTHSGIDPACIQDIAVGTVLNPKAAYEARAAALVAGIPETTPISVVNRFCSSGLLAVTQISNAIRTGQIEVGLAVGLESMSSHPDDGAPKMSEEIMSHPVARDTAMPMGWTSENVAQDFGISRATMDKYAAMSFQRAEKAQATGKFTEIVPTEGFSKDPTTGERKRILVSADDGIRPNTTAEGLGKIRSAFPQWAPSHTTGGNASQITDGAAAVLLMTRKRAEELGLKPIAKYVTTSVVGLAPRIMGIGPSFAIPEVLKASGLGKEDVDLFEINEAFASMYVYCVETLQLDINKVNVNGGAIALGARQIATGLAELERRQGKVLVTSMCIGTGMGAAAVFVRE